MHLALFLCRHGDAAPGPDSSGDLTEVQQWKCTQFMQGTRSGYCSYRRFCQSLGCTPRRALGRVCLVRLGVDSDKCRWDGGYMRARQYGLVAGSAPRWAVTTSGRVAMGALSSRKVSKVLVIFRNCNPCIIQILSAPLSLGRYDRQPSSSQHLRITTHTVPAVAYNDNV